MSAAVPLAARRSLHQLRIASGKRVSYAVIVAITVRVLRKGVRQPGGSACGRQT